MKSIKVGIITVMVGIALLFGMQSTALAISFGIQVTDSVRTVTVLDNQSADDLNPALGVILISLTDSAFSININTAITNSPGDATGATVDTGWQVGTGTGTGGLLTITSSATDFTVPPTGAVTTLVSSFGGTIAPGANTAAAQQWENPSNLLFAMTGATSGVQGPFGPPGFFDMASVGFTSTTPYSITEELTLNLAPGGQTSGDLNSTAGKVPEPISLILLGSGLAGAGLYRRLRKPKKA